MGFTEPQVLQMYWASEKKEEVATQLLLDNAASLQAEINEGIRNPSLNQIPRPAGLVPGNANPQPAPGFFAPQQPGLIPQQRGVESNEQAPKAADSQPPDQISGNSPSRPSMRAFRPQTRPQMPPPNERQNMPKPNEDEHFYD